LGAASTDENNTRGETDEESDDGDAGRRNGGRAATIDTNLGYTQYAPDSIVPFEYKLTFSPIFCGQLRNDGRSPSHTVFTGSHFLIARSYL
jgi:hypothetical protein